MARPFVLAVSESIEYLEKSLRQAKSGSHKERLQMLWWVKSGAIEHRKEISERLGRSPSTISRWLSLYRQGGLTALLEEKKAPGATPHIQGAALEKLKERLQQPEGFRSYRAIQQWLQQEMALVVKEATVRHTVRYKLGAKLKVPRPQSLQQSPEAIETFKKNCSQL